MHPLASAPTFSELRQLLQDLHLSSSASELHGVVSGLLAGGVRFNRQQLIKFLEAHSEADQAFDEPLVSSLWQMQLATLEQLGSSDLVFAPLLPDDEDLLQLRVMALADWCQGLLAGFGLAVRGDDPRLQNGDVMETLRDLTHVAQVSGDAQEGDDEDENAYMELYEFVRLAVIHLFEELSPQEEHREPHTQLH